MIHWQNEVCGTELKTIKYSLCLEGFPCWDAVFFLIFFSGLCFGGHREFTNKEYFCLREKHMIKLALLFLQISLVCNIHFFTQHFILGSVTLLTYCSSDLQRFLRNPEIVVYTFYQSKASGQ